MFTCRTCKLLKHSRLKKGIYQDDDGAFVEYRCGAIIDALSEWHCPFRWWSIKPLRGEGCMNWENMNGKHWI